MTLAAIPFFATAQDLADLLRAVQAARDVKFVRAGLFDSPQEARSDPTDKVKPFGLYLVLDRNTEVLVESIPQRKGGVKYAVDQRKNPESGVLRTGGLVTGSRLVSGQFGTVKDGPTAVAIHTIWGKEVRHRFEKIRSFYVGSEAAMLLDSGIRLTPTMKSPPEYDLSRIVLRGGRKAH